MAYTRRTRTPAPVADLKLIEVLKLTSFFVRRDGWVSKGAARFSDKPATAGLVMEAIRTPSSDIKPTRTDTRNAKDAIAWVQSFAESADLSDYESNLYRACLDDDGNPRALISDRAVGLAASAVGVYLKRKADEAAREKAASEAGPYVGKIGQRITVTAELVELHYSARWDCFAHTWRLEDGSGSLVSWFTRQAQGKIGDSHEITGTVKDHTEFRGIPQTKLNRCRIA